MIIECLGGINFDKIDNGIYTYQKEHMGNYPNYLIMNYKTFDEMHYSSYAKMISTIKGNTLYFTYHGIPVAKCDKLKYGEVDFI
jgi:hypothetical protein